MDVLNICATIAVLFLHSSEFSFNYVPNSLRWIISILIQCVFIPAVPIFFMLSGGNLLNYSQRYSTIIFLKKRFFRTFLPFVFWSVVWFYYHYFSKIRPLWNKNLVSGILNDQIQPVFWFFYSIFGLYVITPVLTKIMSIENKKLIEYMIFGCLFCTGIVSYFYQIGEKSTPILFSSIPIFTSSALFYYLVGWYLKNIRMTKIQKKTLYIVGVLGAFFMIGLTIILSIHQHKTARSVYTVFGVFAMLYSVAVYQFIRCQLENWVPSQKCTLFIRTLSSLSLGIYCVHEFIIYYFEDVIKLPAGSYYHMLVLPVVAYIISALIVYILKKIPIIRYALP